MSHFSLLVIGDDPEGQLDQFYDEKWDWYAIGGRWAGSLKLKPEYAHYGEPREEAWNSPEVLPGWCDQAYKDQIDFSSMAQELSEEATMEFDRIQRATAGLQKPLSIQELNALYPSMFRSHLMRRFWEQRFCKAIQELYPESIFIDPMQFVGIEKESYVETCNLQNLYPFFAVLNNGVWHERGGLLWLSLSGTQHSDYDWYRFVQKQVQEAPGETLLTVIDCHH